MFLGYHEFAPVVSRDVYTLTPAVFAGHIALVRSLVQDSAGTITFDDAHRSQVQLALPLLSAAGTMAHFFVPTARVGKDPNTADWAQLREIARLGHQIGSHSHTHPLLTQCSPLALQEELTASKKNLEDRLGLAVQTISLPGGRYNARVLAACAQAGYARVYTSAPDTGALGRPRNTAEGVEVIGRLIVRRGMQLETLAGYLAGTKAVTRRLWVEYKIKENAKTLLGDRLYQRLWRRALRDLASESTAVVTEPLYVESTATEP